MMTHPIHGSSDVINRLQDVGKKVFFITNNSTKTRTGFLDKAHSLGYKVGEENIISTSYAAAKYLQKRQFNKKVFLIGSSGISEELDNVGIRHTGIGPDIIKTTFHDMLVNDFKIDPEVGAVIVGFDEHFSFPKMLKAANYLNDPNCLFIII